LLLFWWELCFELETYLCIACQEGPPFGLAL
jgi:hypothetical protein